jgi:hypothetical protein
LIKEIIDKATFLDFEVKRLTGKLIAIYPYKKPKPEILVEFDNAEALVKCNYGNYRFVQVVKFAKPDGLMRFKQALASICCMVR